MFIQSCFIRKNTSELRKKLEELGYKICKCCEFEDAVWLDNFIENGTIHGIGYFDEIFPVQTVEEALNMFLEEKKPNDIDCGYNEELFLAIAALRDDSNYMQWFTNGDKWYQDKINDLEVIRFGAGSPIEFHKATVQELIEHFKNE